MIKFTGILSGYCIEHRGKDIGRVRKDSFGVWIASSLNGEQVTIAATRGEAAHRLLQRLRRCKRL